GILQHEAGDAAHRRGGHTVDEQLAGLLPLLRPAEDAGETVQQRRLAGPGAAEQQHPFAGRHDEVEALHGGAAAASGPDVPAPEAPTGSARSPGGTTRSRPCTAGSRRPACRQPQPRASIRAPAGACGVTVSPAPSHAGSARSRPAAKRPRAPVAASARTSRHDTTPASTAPVMIAAITYTTAKSGVRDAAYQTMRSL